MPSAAFSAVSVWAGLVIFVLPFECRDDVDSGVAAIIQYADDRVGKLDRHALRLFRFLVYLRHPVVAAVFLQRLGKLRVDQRDNFGKCPRFLPPAVRNGVFVNFLRNLS